MSMGCLHRKSAWLVMLVVVSALLLPLNAATENRLEGTFWTEQARQLLPGPVPDRILDREQQGEQRNDSEEEDGIDVVPPPEQRLLAEARHVFSGMLYGWRFRYVPQNKARGYQEQFELEPVYELPWGDAGLRIRQTWEEGNHLLARIEYRMDASQQARSQSWGSSSTVSAQGRGESPYRDGYPARQAALKDALRMAVREHFRSRHSTPPRVISGSIVLDDVPVFGVVSGNYTAAVRARMIITELRRYEVF